MNCLFILEINPLSVGSFANSFSHSESCLHLVYGFLCCAEVFKFIQVPFVYFCFYFYYSRRWIEKDLAVICIKDCFAYVFLKGFAVPSLQLSLQSILILFLCMGLGSVLISFVYL